MWAGFIVFIVAMLAIDLFVVQRRPHQSSIRESLILSTVWVILALAFAGGVYTWFGSTASMEFLTGYIIEKTLSVDNLFVFVVVFASFRVPPEYQHRVLFWGILGALVMRGLAIAAGAALLNSFHWIAYVFGAVLILTAIKLVRHKDREWDPEENFAFRFAKRILPFTDRYDGGHFLSKASGRWVGTPLLLVLLIIEATDVVFAIDSVPAIFAVTSDPFLVFTSNIFAILGLRSLYFLLAGSIQKFVLLKPALSLILAFTGVKMLLASVYKIPAGISLLIILTILTVAIIGSIRLRSREHRENRSAVVTGD